MESVFRVDGERIIASPAAGGPWDPRMQHGAAPSALVVWAAEALPTAVPMRIARLTVDLIRPVPVAPLTWRSEVLREGRKIQLCSVKLLSDDVVVAVATVLKVRAQAVKLPSEVLGPAVTLPGPEHAPEELGHAASSPFVACVSMRAARGHFGVPGPAAIWFRLDRPLIEGFAVSQAVRAAVAADFGNGVAPALDFRKWTFINADLTVSLAREPVGEWILVDAESWIGSDGAGLVMSRLADTRGYFGRAVQSLVIEPR
jgi:hypothetical protein